MRCYGRVEYVVNGKIIWQNLEPTSDINKMELALMNWIAEAHISNASDCVWHLSIYRQGQGLSEYHGNTIEELEDQVLVYKECYITA